MRTQAELYSEHVAEEVMKAKAKLKSDPLAAAAQGLIDAHVSVDVDDDLTALLNESSKASGREFVRKPQYTADAMVQLFIDHPQWTHSQFADHFGYRASWFAGVLISNNLQAALERRREEVAAVNPLLAGTMQEMFQAATVQALSVLQLRMEDPKATNELLLDVAKIGIKALGLGNPNQAPAVKEPPRTIHDLASGLLKANPPAQSTTPANDLTIEIALQEVPASNDSNDEDEA
jgi:hypothetical protein